MYQKWRDLLFLHWRWDAEDLAHRLPPGLHLDTFEGQAWIGIIPLFIHDLRLRAMPAVPGLSSFMELNVRTYVHDNDGRPGIWFFSLDAASAPAVFFARQLLKLPYFRARMRSHRSDGMIDYTSRRYGQEMESRYRYRPAEAQAPAEPESLEFFLIERYFLFSWVGNTLWSGQVHHTPYPLHAAEVSEWDDHILALDGFTATGIPFDHAVYSPGVDMQIYPPKRICGSPSE